MAERRVVRITDAFEADLDRQLPDERSAAGTPSRLDFLLFEMDKIIEIYATRFDQLPPVVDAAPTIRSLIGQGALVSFYFVAGQLNTDNEIELLTIDIELLRRA